MIIHKCDRCGKLFEMNYVSNFDKHSVRIGKPGIMDDRLDLCDECTESIRRWVIDPNATVTYDPATEEPDYNRRTTFVDRVRKLFDKDKAREAAAKLKETEK